MYNFLTVKSPFFYHVILHLQQQYSDLILNMILWQHKTQPQVTHYVEARGL